MWNKSLTNAYKVDEIDSRVIAMAHSSVAIANYLLDKSRPIGGLDALQTLKLAYISNGFYLGAYDRSLIIDDVEAWKYGPVIRAIYARVPYGSAKIGNALSAERAILVPQEQSILDSVFEKYGKLSGVALSSLTHREGTPWDLTWKRFGQNAVIPRELIRDHYKRVLSGGTATIGTIGL
jgi:uncharacterized phage-associated protein